MIVKRKSEAAFDKDQFLNDPIHHDFSLKVSHTGQFLCSQDWFQYQSLQSRQNKPEP
jgi:hypothetical protein